MKNNKKVWVCLFAVLLILNIIFKFVGSGGYLNYFAAIFSSFCLGMEIFDGTRN